MTSQQLNAANSWNLPPGLRAHADEVEVLPLALQRRLLAEVQLGRQASTRLDDPTCSPHQRTGLEAQVRIGKRAMDRLVCSNMRLVIWVVAHTRRQRWLDREDLIQEGVRGLTRAIEKFDLTLGTTLSTYATLWIRQSVGRAIMNSGLVRIPVHVQDGTTRSDLRDVASRFDEIMSIEGIFDELHAVQVDALAAAEPDEWREADVQMDRAFVDNDDYVEAVDAHEIAADLLAHLDEREVFILKSRCGIEFAEQTLQQIGDTLNLTRERVRQIEERALAKCRTRIGASHR